MAAQGVGEESTPTKRFATRVDWFRRDGGGGTIYVKPAEHGTAPHPVAEYSVEDPASGGSSAEAEPSGR